jgi:hypothetical protein
MDGDSQLEPEFDTESKFEEEGSSHEQYVSPVSLTGDI